jgi:type-F conjugative transfer system pilin assembly protein TrbC
MAQKKLLYVVISALMGFSLFSENPPETYFTAKGCKNGCGSKILNAREKTDMENGILVFVSFSMPDISLRELGENAEKHGATLIIRGLHLGSFVKTRDKILSVSKNGLQLDINPEFFRKYRADRVPTFILVENGEEIHRLSGNVTLEYAAEKLRSREK